MKIRQNPITLTGFADNLVPIGHWNYVCTFHFTKCTHNFAPGLAFLQCIAMGHRFSYAQFQLSGHFQAFLTLTVCPLGNNGRWHVRIYLVLLLGSQCEKWQKTLEKGRRKKNIYFL